MNLYKKCTAKPIIDPVIDPTLSSDNHISERIFEKEYKN